MDSYFWWIFWDFRCWRLYTIDRSIFFLFNYFCTNNLIWFENFWWILKYLLRSVAFYSYWIVWIIDDWWLFLNFLFDYNSFVQRYFCFHFDWSLIIYYRLFSNFRNIWFDYFRFIFLRFFFMNLFMSFPWTIILNSDWVIFFR
jgi:hypothetical protein